MTTDSHWIVASGDYYLTWLGGYSSNIDEAMFVKEDIELVGSQQLVRIHREHRTRIIFYGRMA